VQRRNTGVVVMTVLMVLLFMAASYLLGVAAASEPGGAPANELFNLRNQRASLVDRTLDLIEHEYYMPLTPELRQQLVYAALRGITEELGKEPFDDQFSHFFDPELYKDLNAQTTGEYAGIGVLMGETTDGSYPEIETVFPKTPAEEAGLLEKDVITEVGGKDAFEMILPEVATTIKGEPGTKVKLKIFRPDTGEFKDFEVTRRAVQYSSVSKTEMLANNVGYIEVSSFAEDTGPDFRNSMEQLSKDGMKSLIIDLRNNTGGLLDAAQAMADCFVKQGPIVEVNYRNAKPVILEANSKHKKYKLPVVILINGSSASASEVFTAAMKDYDLATTVGEKSFGKGVVQEVTPMEREVVETAGKNGETIKSEVVKDAIALTIGKYYTPKREEIHKIGITPDVYYDLENQLRDDPKLKELQQRITAKAEELRQLRAEVNRYLRNNDAQRDRAVKVAQQLARGEKVQRVAKLEPEKKDRMALLGTNAPAVPPADAVKDDVRSKSEPAPEPAH
jgi:carboxyl-terminal processing protease